MRLGVLCAKGVGTAAPNGSRGLFRGHLARPRLTDLLDSLRDHGFRRIAIVNGHGGNTAAVAVVREWVARNDHARVVFHDWWNAPRVWDLLPILPAA